MAKRCQKCAELKKIVKSKNREIRLLKREKHVALKEATLIKPKKLDALIKKVKVRSERIVRLEEQNAIKDQLLLMLQKGGTSTKPALLQLTEGRIKPTRVNAKALEFLGAKHVNPVTTTKVFYLCSDDKKRHITVKKVYETEVLGLLFDIGGVNDGQEA